jgi:hypothetical protein
VGSPTPSMSTTRRSPSSPAPAAAPPTAPAPTCGWARASRRSRSTWRRA